MTKRNGKARAGTRPDDVEWNKMKRVGVETGWDEVEWYGMRVVQYSTDLRRNKEHAQVGVGHEPGSEDNYTISLFIWKCRFFQVFFCAISALSLYVEYVVCSFLPDGVFFTL